VTCNSRTSFGGQSSKVQGHRCSSCRSLYQSPHYLTFYLRASSSLVILSLPCLRTHLSALGITFTNPALATRCDLQSRSDLLTRRLFNAHQSTVFALLRTRQPRRPHNVLAVWVLSSCYSPLYDQAPDRALNFTFGSVQSIFTMRPALRPVCSRPMPVRDDI